jgi:hypothetical protein
MPATPQERALGARIAAFSRWAHEPDRTAATHPARAAFDRRFDDEVDPDRALAPEERAGRAAAARKAYFSRLALRSAQARRRAGEYTSAAIAAEDEIAAGARLEPSAGPAQSTDAAAGGAR